MSFSSKDFRIVPHTTCAKIIEITPQKTKLKHYLGLDECIKEKNSKRVLQDSWQALTQENQFLTLAGSLCAVNRLLCQLVYFVLKSKDYLSDNYTLFPLPFQISPSNIGGVNLPSLSDNDDKSWLYVVNCIAADLDWISKHVQSNHSL